MFIVDSDPEDLDKDLGGMTSDGDVHTGGCHHYLAIVVSAVAVAGIDAA